MLAKRSRPDGHSIPQYVHEGSRREGDVAAIAVLVPAGTFGVEEIFQRLHELFQLVILWDAKQL